MCGLGGKRDKCLCSFPGVGRGLKKLFVPPSVLFPSSAPSCFNASLQCVPSTTSLLHTAAVNRGWRILRTDQTHEFPITPPLIIQVPAQPSGWRGAMPLWMPAVHYLSIMLGFVLLFMESWITVPCGNQGLSTDYHIFKGMLFAAPQVTLEL